MARLTIDSIVTGATDFERTQYCVLAHLKEAREAFARNELYPHLSDLVQAYNSLDGVLSNLSSFRESFPGQLTGIDLQSGKLIYDRSDLSNHQIDAIGEMIDWALPKILETIDEGRTIFEFVDGHLVLEEVGILPSYLEEGYLLLPDVAKNSIEVVQYELSIYASANERYRTLKTTHMRTISVGVVAPSPSVLKMELVSSNQALPNPATYTLHSDIDFPYAETVLPIAKRKLMHRLFGTRGIA